MISYQMNSIKQYRLFSQHNNDILINQYITNIVQLIFLALFICLTDDILIEWENVDLLEVTLDCNDDFLFLSGDFSVSDAKSALMNSNRDKNNFHTNPQHS